MDVVKHVFWISVCWSLFDYTTDVLMYLEAIRGTEVSGAYY